MKITKIKIKNFKTLKSVEYVPKNKIAVLCASNGMGKTSFLEACRFALTGTAPDNCINDFANETTVEIAMANDFVFSRTKHRAKPTKIRVNGKSTTAKNLDLVLADKSGIGKETMRIATSQDVLASLKPDELGAFLMSYVPEELDFQTLLKFIPNLTPDTQAELASYFPSMPIRFGLDTVAHAYSGVFEARGHAGKERANRMAQINPAATGAPNRPLDDIIKEEEKILFIEGSQASAKAALDLYEEAVATRKKAEDNLRDLEMQIEGISATKPNDSIMTSISNKKQRCNNAISAASSMLAMIQGNLEIFTDTLANLNNTVCPISDKLICTTDKSKVREEVLEIIQANKDGIEIQNKIIEDSKKELLELRNQEEAWNNNAIAYAKKVALVGRLEAEKKNIPSLPVFPTVLGTVTDFSIRKKELKEERIYCEAYEKNQRMMREGDALKQKFDTLNFLCKALEPKGVVVTGITESYLTIFEDAINKRADELGTGYSVKFIANNGVNYTIRTNRSKEYHQFTELSKGEQLIAIFLLLDMLNKLCGTRIMLLDDINHLDSCNFNTLFDLLCSKALQDDYDHIFLCAAINSDFDKRIKSIGNVDFVL